MEKRNESIFLTFNEANILIFNLVDKDRQGFLLALEDMFINTKDRYLKKDIESLISKIESLTPIEFSFLRRDAVIGKVLSPAGYHLPYIH